MACARNSAEAVSETVKTVALGRDSRFLEWAEQVLGQAVQATADVDRTIRELGDGSVDLLVVYLPDLEMDPTRACALLNDAAPIVPLIGVDEKDAPTDAEADLELVASGMSARLSLQTPDSGVRALLQAHARRFAAVRRDVERDRRYARQIVEYQKWSARSVERIHEWVHELRTPLGVIEGYAANLQDGVYGSLDDPQQAIVTRLRNAGKLLSRLVTKVRDDLPSPPKLEDAGEEPRQQRRTKLSLQSVCEEVVGFFESKAASRRVRLRLEASSCPEVWGDRMRLTQAL